MIRRSFNLAAAVSLLLFLVVAVLWVRSYWVGHRWADTRVARAAGSLTFEETQVDVGRGGVRFVALTATVAGPAREHAADPGYARPGSWVEHRALASYPSRPASQPVTFEILGVQRGTIAGAAPPLRGWWVIVPMRVAAAVLAVLPLVWLVARVRRAGVRRSRLRRGLCAACGFDLRSTPIRCPECGTPPRGVDRLFEQIGRAEAAAATATGAAQRPAAQAVSGAIT